MRKEPHLTYPENLQIQSSQGSTIFWIIKAQLCSYYYCSKDWEVHFVEYKQHYLSFTQQFNAISCWPLLFGSHTCTCRLHFKWLRENTSLRRSRVQCKILWLPSANKMSYRGYIKLRVSETEVWNWNEIGDELGISFVMRKVLWTNWKQASLLREILHVMRYLEKVIFCNEVVNYINVIY